MSGMKPVERITREELHARLKAQGVSGHQHWAMRCVICGTVQSGASLMRAGASPDRAESMIGFSCEGRLTKAGPWPAPKDRSVKAKKRRNVRGCDWTLGGLFRIHNLEVMWPDGELTEVGEIYAVQPAFEVATAAEAITLQAWLEMTERDGKA